MGTQSIGKANPKDFPTRTPRKKRCPKMCRQYTSQAIHTCQLHFRQPLALGLVLKINGRKENPFPLMHTIPYQKGGPSEEIECYTWVFMMGSSMSFRLKPPA